MEWGSIEFGYIGRVIQIIGYFVFYKISQVLCWGFLVVIVVVEKGLFNVLLESQFGENIVLLERCEVFQFYCDYCF